MEGRMSLFPKKFKGPQGDELGQSERRSPDVILKCGNVRIPANRNILAGASRYFRAMFSDNFSESYAPEIEMHEIDAHCLEMCVHFIYTGLLDITESNVRQIFITASFLQMKCIEEKCCEYIVSKMEVGNCLEFKLLAETHYNLELRNECENFIITHFEEVVKSEDFYELCVDELTPILDYEERTIHFEDKKLCALVQWAEYKYDERCKNLRNLLRRIDPYCISLNEARSLRIFERDEAYQSWLGDVETMHSNNQFRIFFSGKICGCSNLYCLKVNSGKITTREPMPNKINDFSLAPYKHFLYVCGGVHEDKPSIFLRDSYSYNVCQDKWYEWCPLLLGRSIHRAVVLQDDLYILGGAAELGITNSVECLNVPANTIQPSPSMIESRALMGAVAYDRALYIMGGISDNQDLNSMERFDPRQGMWERLPSMNQVDSICNSVVVNDSIYCSDAVYFLERFDLRANQWENMECNIDEGLGFELLGINNSIYALSPYGLLSYDVEAQHWSEDIAFGSPIEELSNYAVVKIH